MKISYQLVVILATLLPTSALAEAGASTGIDIGMSAATIGDLGESFGVEAGYFLTPTLRARLSYSSLKYENNRVVGSISFTENMDQQNTRLTLDWFPWKHLHNGLYGSIGLTRLGDSASLSAHADTSLSYPLDGILYSGTQLGSISGTINTKSTLPYIGVGFKHDFNYHSGRGLFFQAEVGSVFGLESELTLQSDNPANIPALATSLQAYANQQNDKFEDNYTLYALTIGYRF